MESFKFAIILIIATLIIGINTFDTKNGRIVGGQTAVADQFPHHVALFHEDVYICGGFIINQQWIGSAAHCVITLSATNLKLVYGTVSLVLGGITNTADLIINHSGYVSVTLQNDVSVIRTVDRIVFSDTVKAVLFDISVVPGGAKGFVSGYGSLQDGGPFSEDLQYIIKNTITNDECITLLDAERANRIIDSSLCTLNPSGEGICSGDAGSALIYNGAIIGIASWGVPCGLGNPDAYARVSSYIGWILQQIRDN